MKAMNRIQRLAFITAIILYIIIAALFGVFSYQMRMKDAIRQFGDKAMLIAVKYADDLVLDDKEYDRLLSLDFVSLLKDKTNVDFEQQARKVMKYSDIKYIYMFSILPPDKVKYKVEKGEEETYGMPVGTPLKLVYLLDAVKSDEIRMEDTEGNWYVDKDRYNVVDADYSDIISAQKASYLIVNDRWGSYVTGYAPVYSTQGTLMGYLGVDLFQNKYLETIKQDNVILAVFLMMIFVIVLLLLYLFMRYTNMERIACEKTFFSDYDLLTSVYSRRRIYSILYEKWDECKKKHEKMCLLFMDIDNFKKYNDQNGHYEGDELLCKVASTVRETVEKSGGYLGRYGGDEFIAVLVGTDKGAAEKVCSKILGEVRTIRVKQNGELITLSIGINEIDFEVENVDSAVENTDKALYEAKKNGKNRYFIHEA